MKCGIQVVLVLVCCCVGWAQGPDACVQCVCVADNTCTTHSGCGQLDGCAGVNFTSICGGQYTIKVVLKCDSDEICEDCFACGLVSQNGQPLWNIAQAGCNTTCEGTTTVNLTYNQQYTLHACLRACAGVDCRTCESCTVRAYIYKAWSDCTPIPPCDP